MTQVSADLSGCPMYRIRVRQRTWADYRMLSLNEWNRSKGFAGLIRPTYAGANMGHPDWFRLILYCSFRS